LLSTDQNFLTCYESALVFSKYTGSLIFSQQLMRTHFKILENMSGLNSKGTDCREFWHHCIRASEDLLWYTGDPEAGVNGISVAHW